MDADYRLKFWWWIAIGTRVVACFTQLSYSHPDEWTQTVEFGHFLASGVISQTQEFFLHMRNLSWPMLISVVFRLAEWMAPGDVLVRMTGLKLLTAGLDLGIFWGWTRLVLVRTRGMDSKWNHLGYGVLALCPWAVMESVRPSLEHLSAIALWIGLGCSAIGRTGFAGVAAAWTGVFRYPSGLLALGFLALPPRSWARLALGAGTGLLLGGLADAWFYGRPFESLWMYLQFNIWTGLSARNFGAQSAAEYLRYFRDAWAGILLPWGLLVAILAPLGFWQGLKSRATWAWSLFFYGVGHLWIAHKEPRFMAPVFLLVLWASFEGAIWIFKFKKIRKLNRPLVILLLLSGSLGMVRVLWGETWRVTDNYLEVSGHLKREKSVCAVVTVRKPFSFLLPRVALAFFPADHHASSFDFMQTRPLIWIQKEAECKPGDSILLQPYRPDERWERIYNCEILRSGILKWLPAQKEWSAAPWYRCPMQQILSSFARTEERRVLAFEMSRLEPLPLHGVSAEELMSLATQRGKGFRDGTLGDW